MSSLAPLLLVLAAATQEGPDGPHQANGVKIGDVDRHSALVWVRATRHAERRADGPEFPRDGVGPGDDPFPEGLALADMRHSVPGAPALARVVWRDADGDVGDRTDWAELHSARDFAHVFALEGLPAGRTIELRSEVRPIDSGEVSTTCEARFRTAPLADEARRVRFTVVTGQAFHRRDDAEGGHRIYPRMAALDPDFFVHTGDVVYYDKPGPWATTEALARHKWNRTYALPHQRAFHRRVAAYFLKDDHDVLKNDCWPGQRYGELEWDDGLRLFREQVPVGPSPYRTVRWGRDLQVWLLEGREFRSPNRSPDGPEKTILGAEQLAWLERTLDASDATFRIVISPTPIVGPDRASKNDNHANAGFAHEGGRLRAMLAERDHVVVVCGDRHWQYVSEDPETGLVEFASGPTTDAHAGGFPDELRPMHRYLRVAGGFLSVTVERADGAPTATFRHHDVEGAVRNAVALAAE